MGNREIATVDDDAIYDQVLALLEQESGGSQDWIRARLELDPSSSRENSLAALVDGKVVSHLRILPREMRVGRSMVSVAGVADVATIPAERGHGHVRALLEAALPRMASAGFGISMVFSDETEPFGSLGWNPLPVTTYVADVIAGRSGASDPGIRPLKPEDDLIWVAALHGEYGSGYAGPFVRSLGWWSGNVTWMLERPESSVVLEREGRIVGYGRARYFETPDGVGPEDDYSISDLAAEEADGEADLLTWFVKDAGERGFQSISGQAPVPGRAKEMFEKIGIRSRSRDDNRMMLRIIDLRALLKSLRPEFASALSSRGDNRAGLVGVRVGADSAELSVRDSTVHIGPMQDSDPLVLSDMELWALIFTGSVPDRAGSAEKALLEALFKKREFAFWRADVF